VRLIAGWDQGWYERFSFEVVISASLVPWSRRLIVRDGLPIRWFGTFFATTLPAKMPIRWESGMPMYSTRTESRRFEFGKNHLEAAQFIEGHVNRVANGRIRDLHVVYSDDKIILQGRSRTYHAKQLAHQAVLDLTDGHPLLANQIVVS
jgi:hypothetical protein